MAFRGKAGRPSTPVSSRPGSRLASTPSPGPSSRSSQGTPSPSLARRRFNFGENLNEPEIFTNVQLPHPALIVESASLASVTTPVPSFKLTSKLKIGLSELQLDTIASACVQHERKLPDGSRAGFLIGHGTGVGKGRVIAGLISENREKKRKRAIWISMSSELKNAAQQDLADIGAGKIQVHLLTHMQYGHKISSDANGRIKKGVIFATYSCLIGKSRSTGETRMEQLLKWFHHDYDGLIVFDECHQAKNCVAIGSTEPSKTGLAVLELQNKLPNARIIYVTATGASEPRHLGYMVRLGLWGQGTPFYDFASFIVTIEKNGVGGLELLAMEMKHRGMYIARQLSFKDVSFKVVEVALSPVFIKSYNDSVILWVELFQSFTEVAELTNLGQNTRNIVMNQFWSAHQRFFKCMAIASKVAHVIQIAKKALEDGKCVVIGLQSTGEARTLEQIENEGELSDFVSTAKGILQTLVNKHFPVPESSRVGLEKGASLLDQLGIDPESYGESSGTKTKRNVACKADNRSKKKARTSNRESTDHEPDSDFEPKDSSSRFMSDSEDLEGQINIQAKKKDNPPPPEEALDMAFSIKERLLAKIEQLGANLPPNTLDQLIDELGGPENVAEMTGRTGRVRRVVNNDDEVVRYESRANNSNWDEKERFMKGEKYVAIISKAASVGISLHADKAALNTRRRVHIILELPWSADKAIQQFGRTHRSNQVFAPEYVLLVSKLAGEYRFMSSVATRLRSLGALTQGDRRANETWDLSQFSIDAKYGQEAVEATLKAVMGCNDPLISPSSATTNYKGEFFKDVSVALVGVGLICNNERDKNVSVEKFLNRILGMPVDLQNRLFQYFSDILAAIVRKEKENGRFDDGIRDLLTGEIDLKRQRCFTFSIRQPTGTTETLLQTFQLDCGMSWEAAEKKSSILVGAQEGFYKSKRGKDVVQLVVDSAPHLGLEKGKSQYKIYRPPTGLQDTQLPLAKIKEEFDQIDHAKAQKIWEQEFRSSATKCFHQRWSIDGICREPPGCELGRRIRTFNILSGPILSVLDKVESVLHANAGLKPQVFRLRSGGTRIIGIEVPNTCMQPMIKLLKEESENVSEEEF